jgi:hypothetical protein
MKKTVALLAGVAFIMALLSACGGGGGLEGDTGPFGKFLTHYDNMIKIIRDNKDNPEKASEALAAYQEQNQAELDRLSKEMEEYSKKDPMKALQLTAAVLKKTEELTQLSSEIYRESGQ